MTNREAGLQCQRLLVAVTLVSSILISQSANAQRGSNEPAFTESAVDRIAAKIKQDLKGIKSQAPDSPEPPSPNSTPSPNAPSTSTPAPSKSPIQSKPPKAARVRAVETSALKCQAAEEAVVLYKIFLAGSDVTDEEREQAQNRLEYWEQAAADQLVRVGTKWMPKGEADALLKEADKLVVEAIEMLNVDNFAGANAKLEKAAKVYPEHLESVFLLAVGAFNDREYKAAEIKFNECLSRAPNHVPLLNNIGVCEIQMKRYDKAAKHLQKAATIDPENKAVAQNLGKFISEASNKKLLDKRMINDLSDSYQAMITKEPGNRADTDRGYRLTQMFRENGVDKKSPEENRIVGNGTGFVVANGFVLTNRHVVEDADALVVQDPLKPNGVPLAAKVIGVSKDLDIAVLECRDLKTPAVPLNTVPVSRGAEVMALGFPIANVVGKGLKATRGIITGLPSEDTNKMLVLDVQVNPGNSGGPLCDKTGRVVGIVSAKTYTATFVQGYGLAIPINDAMPFLKQYIPNFASPSAETKPLEWTEVDERISQSTVMILIQKKR